MSRIPPTHKSRVLVPPDIVFDPNNPLTVNSCSGHPDEHAPGCDGFCTKNVVDELDIRIENEKRAWARLGMVTQGYESYDLRQDAQIHAIISVLQNKLGISDEEFNEAFKLSMLVLMQRVRHDNEENAKAAQARSRIIVPKGPLQ